MHIDFDSLRGIGLSRAVLSRLGAMGIPPGLRLARVTETQRDRLTLHDGREDHFARPTHRLYVVLQARDTPPTVGDGRGKHTTTARSLHFCAGGACIIDTPGLRTWRPDADADALAATYDDVAALEGGCRFRDCRHEGEPGCAVRDAVAPDRLSNYRKLLRDAQRADRTPLERIALRRKWKAIGKAGGDRLKEKRR